MKMPVRENSVPIRLSDTELETVVIGAVLAGVNRSEFIRHAAKAKAEELMAKFPEKTAEVQSNLLKK